MKNVKLIVPANFTFTADNNFFIALGVPEKIFLKTNIKYSLVFSGSYKISLVKNLPQNHYHYTVTKIKDGLDVQPSSLLACMQVSHYDAAFPPMQLGFLELDKGHCCLDFKTFD